MGWRSWSSLPGAGLHPLERIGAHQARLEQERVQTAHDNFKTCGNVTCPCWRGEWDKVPRRTKK